MERKVFSITGEELKTLKLNEAVFNREISEGAIYHAIRNELANCRVGTASVKTRGEVKGTSRKPWKQKGTGRARAGRRRSPLWVGGGVIFGPQPRSYNYSLPKKLKQLAMKSILSLKAKEDRITIVEDFSIENGKTRELVKILKKLVSDERTVIVLKDDDRMLKRAGANLPMVRFLSYNRLRAHDLFYGRNILMLESAVHQLNVIYGGDSAGVEA